VAAALAIKPLTPDGRLAVSAQSAAISIEELYRQVNLRALPQLEIEDLC
jgi:hypothetical protein